MTKPNKTVKAYLAEIGRRGGKAGTGAAKARKVSSEQARAAVAVRWARARAARLNAQDEEIT